MQNNATTHHTGLIKLFNQSSVKSVRRRLSPLRLYLSMMQSVASRSSRWAWSIIGASSLSSDIVLRSAVKVLSSLENVLSDSAVHTCNVARMVSMQCMIGRASAGHLLTATTAETSSSRGGFWRHMAAHTANSAFACTSEASGTLQQTTLIYLWNAGWANSHVAEVMFLGSRNASENAACWCFENLFFQVRWNSRVQYYTNHKN